MTVVKSVKTRRKVGAAVSCALAGILFLCFMLPFVMLLINSFKNKRDIISSPFSLTPTLGFTFDNYIQSYEKMDFIRAFGNSLMVTSLSTFFVILFSSMTAYYIVRADNRVGKGAFALMTASMIIPFQALMIPLVSIYGAQLGVLNHRVTLIFMHTGFAMSLSVFMYHGAVKTGIPISLEEAATLDGCTRLQSFVRVVFPLMKPTTATLVILNTLAFWNDYLLPSLVLSDKRLLTLPLSTYLFYGTYSADYGIIMAALVLTIFPIVILFLFLQQHIISGVMSGAVKS